MLQKPLRGVMPQWLWLEQTDHSYESITQRHADLVAAIERFADAGLEVPIAWAEECSMHSDELLRRYEMRKG